MRKVRYGITFKSISAIVFWLLLFAVIDINLGYSAFKDAYIRQYSKDSFHIADTAAMDIDADQLDISPP